ncbi:MAG: A24 family peptidase C-terminal domain-containing protein [Candidatus Hydrothermarchaeota archaeon]|nr:A24 family peptidase C-terminal domain-containing protein [Candidatus Hydrothermarchaeota archaeon]
METLFTALAVLGAGIAAATDLKRGIIPNRLSLSLICIGIFGNFFYSFYANSFELLFLCLQNFIAILIIGYVLWILGGWSAGDVKEFLFLAVLLPRYPNFLKTFFSPTLPPYPFVLTILLNTFLAIFPFIALYSLCISLSKIGISKFLEPLQDIDRHLKNSFIVVGCISLGMLLNSAIALAVLLFFLAIKEKYKLAASAAFLALFLLSGNSFAALMKYFIFLTLFFVSFALFWNSLNVLRKEALREEVKITELKEGVVAAEEFYIQGDKILRDSRDMLEKIKSAIKTRNFEVLRRKGLASTRAAGISKEEIELLKKHVAEGKIEDKIIITKGMPFAPAIFLGLMLSLAFGDLIRRVL